jgi:dephospho-CoA kinase
MDRSGLAAEMVDKMIAAQASRAERLAVADDVIDNSGTREQLRGQVESLHRRYIDFARRLSSPPS